MVFGLPIALWAASSRRHSRVVRAGAVVGLYALLIALVLTYSRGGVLAAFVALAGWFALTRLRFESLAALVSGGVPAGVVCGIALLLPGIAQDGQSHSVRVQDGAWFALAFVLGAGAAFAAAWFLHYRPGPERERLLLRAAAGVAIACVLAGVIVVSASGNPLGGSASVGSGPSRLGESSLNNRWGWWKEAWHGFAGEPLGGTGAGSFEIVHRKFRDSAVDVLETHDLPLQFASETGIVGLALWVGAMGAALLGAWRALGRLDGDEREAALALGLVVPAFLVHGLLDYDWDFVALAGPLLFVIGFLLAAGREPVRVRSSLRLGRRGRARRVGRPLFDRRAADRGRPGGRRVLAHRAWPARAGGVVGEERALAEPALDRGAPGLGLGRGGCGEAPSGARALRAGGRPPAAELGQLVPARALRPRGARARRRGAP